MKFITSLKILVLSALVMVFTVALTTSVEATVSGLPAGPDPIDSGFNYSFDEFKVEGTKVLNSGATINLTKNTPTISGFTKRGVKVYIFVRSEEQGYVTDSDAGNGYFSKQIGPLTNGWHTVYMQVADNQGHFSARAQKATLYLASGGAAGGTSGTTQLAQAGSFAIPLFALAALLVGAGSYLMIRKTK